MRKLKVLLLAGFVAAFLLGVGNAEAIDYKDFKLAAIFQTAIEEPWDGAIHQACLKAKTELSTRHASRPKRSWESPTSLSKK